MDTRLRTHDQEPERLVIIYNQYLFLKNPGLEFVFLRIYLHLLSAVLYAPNHNI